MPTPIYPPAGASVRRWPFFFLFILGALVAGAQTFTLTQVRNTGPRDRRINIVFVAEAFTAAQEAEFNRQAEIIGNMFVNDEGFGRFADHINLFRLFVPSNQAGPDERDRGIFHDTYFNSYLNGGMIGVDDGTVAQYQRVLADQIPDYDIAIMLINMESAVGVLNGLGAVGNGIAWVTTRPADLDLIGRMTLHEAGHAFAALRDEYVTTTPAGGAAPVISAPNISSESARDRVAWSRFIFPSTPTPTTDGWYGYTGADAVGTFAGALNRLDLFRSTSYSRMNNVDRPWGPVNLRAIATAVHRLNLELATTPPTITRQPVGGQIALGQSVTLTVAATGTGPITYQWMRDGIYVPNGHRAGLEIPVMSKQDAGAYSVEVTNSAGTTVSVAVNLTTADGSTGHWDAQDIGAVGLAGRTIDADWSKTLRGSGADIGGTADAFQFAYKTLTGDGKIEVRITNFWLSARVVDLAKAGVMIRESLQPNARNAALLYEWSNGGEFQSRSTTGGTTAFAAHADPAAGWLRITRSGDLFTGYVAKDGGAWQMVGSVSLPGMPATLYIGLAATSHDDSQILTAEFYRPMVTATAATLPEPPTGLSASVTGNTQVTLTWTDASNNETGFEVERSTSGSGGEGPFSRIATLPANSTGYVDTNVASSTQYNYRVRATNAGGASGYSNYANITTPFVPPPSGAWSAGDIGAVAAAGSSSEDSSGVTMHGSGADIWDRADEFYYRYRTWNGDGEFIARVSVFTNTHAWAKAGLMIRESIAAESRHAFMNVSAGHGTSLQYRAATGGDTASTPATESGGASQWLKLVRSGNVLTGYASLDGTTWNLAGSVTLAMPANVLIGLAVTSHNDGMLVESRFDSISFRDPNAPPPTATPLNSPGTLSASAGSASQIALTWSDTNSDEDGFEIQRASNGLDFFVLTTVGANVTNYTNTGLPSNTSYTYRVRATRGTDRSGFTNVASATTLPPAPLAAPSSLSATANSESRITLSWVDNSSDETGFEVEWLDTSGFLPLATLPANTTTFAHTSLTGSTTYTYRVRALRGPDRSSYSNTTTATTAAPTLVAPTNLTADVIAANRIDLHWAIDPNASELGFRIERSRGTAGFAEIGTVGVNATYYADITAEAGTTYRYRVRANYGSNASAYSNEATATTPGVALPAPTGLTATATASNRVELSWTGPGAHEDDFRIERATSGGAYTQLNTNAPGITTYSDPSVSANTTYRYRVRASYAAGMSEYSNEAAVTTPVASPPPGTWLHADVGAIGVAGSDDMTANPATVRGSGSDIWEGADAFHFVYRSLSGDGSIVACVTGISNTNAWAKAGVMIRESLAAGARNTFVLLSAGNGMAVQNRAATGGATTSTPSGVWGQVAPQWVRLTRTGNTVATEWSSNGTSWNAIASFTVSYGSDALVGLAVTSHNNGVLCTANFTDVSINGGTPPPPPPPPTPPGAPTTLTATANSSTAISLAWTDASANETGFEVERSTDNIAFSLRTTTAAGATSFADSGLTASTTYYYRVRAVNAAGASGYSNTASAVTLAAPPPPPPPTPPAAPTGLSATVSSSSAIALAWTDASTNETGFEVGRSSDNVTFSLRTTTAAGATAFNDTGLTAATTFYYRVRAVNAAGNSAYSNTATARTADAPPPPPPPPPATWDTRDIGAVGRPGSVAAIDGGIALTGAGEDIWNNADEFRYYYQPMAGDGELIARVTGLTNTNGWAKAGVMFRESLNANAAHAFMCVSIDHGTSFQYRAATGGDSATSTPSEAAGAIRWVRLVRTGNSIAGYESENGTAWTLVMTRTFAFPGTIYVGLAVTSHNDSTTTTATFTNIALTAGSAPPPPPPVTVNAPSSLSAAAASSTQINLTWTDNATNETGFEIERGVGGGSFSALATVGADRTGYSDTTVTSGTSYSYRVRAVAGTVTSAYSNTASATPTAAPPPPPPTTWSFGDIGGVGVSGSNSSDTNTITVRGSGSDIWERADSFRFVYRALTGDGVVEAQVSSLQNTNGWAKAGVMIRESLAAGSTNAAAFVSTDHGIVAQTRATTNGDTQSVAGPARTAPYWLRLTRSGNTFTFASSADGVSWTTFGTFTIPMNATAFFGFAVTSHDNSQLNTAVFTDPSVH